MDLDSVLAEIGEFGRYQKSVLWFILLPSVFPCGFHAYNQLFMTATPDHWCQVPELKGLNQELVKNISIPFIENGGGQFAFSQCSMYDRSYGNLSWYSDDDNGGNNNGNGSGVVIGCRNGWSYDRSQYETSVVMDWDLVCDRDFSATLALVLLGAGGLVGNYVFGYVQDGLGRKPSFFIYLLVQCVFGVGTAFADSFFVWLVFRVGVGFTVPAILGTPCVLAIELVGARYRTSVSILVNVSYSLSLITLSIIVWAVRDWRHLAIVTTLPFLPLFSLYWTLPESPRWLLSQGRFDEALEVLGKIARANGKQLEPATVALLKRTMDEERRTRKAQKGYGVRDLFRYRNLRLKTLVITFIWFANTSVYVGLSYYAPAIGDDEFLNFFLAGAVELPTYLFLWPAMERWGRRWVLCASMVAGGLACLATFLVRNDSAVTLCLYCMGKMGISSSFVVLPLMASELYPTVVRGLGMSISSVMGMLGPVLIPFVNYLGSDMLTLPLIIMGALLVTGGLCSLLLPETLNQHLPQTLEDGERAGLDCCFACCTPPQNNCMRNAVIHEGRI